MPINNDPQPTLRYLLYHDGSKFPSAEVPQRKEIFPWNTTIQDFLSQGLLGGLLDLVWAGKLLTMFEICGYLYEGNFGCSST